MFVRLSVLIFSTLACLSLVSAAAHPRRSSLPSCNATCPPMDLSEYSLGNYNTDSDPIFCSYPGFPEEDPNAYFCKYDKVSGEILCSSVSNDLALS